MLEAIGYDLVPLSLTGDIAVTSDKCWQEVHLHIKACYCHWNGCSYWTTNVQIMSFYH